MKKLLTILLFIPSVVFCQNKVDSIKNELKTAEHDTAKAMLWLEIGSERIKMGSPDTPAVINSLKNAIKAANRSKHKPTIAKTYYYVSSGYKKLRLDSTAIQYSIKALKEFKSLKDTTYTLNTYQKIARYYHSTSNFPKAIEYYLLHLRAAETVGDSIHMGKAYNGLGNVYNSIDDAEMGLFYLKKSLKIRLALNDLHKASYSYINIGNAFNYKNIPDSAIYYYKKALEIQKKVGNKTGPAWVYSNIGIAMEKKEDYQSALVYYLRAKEIIDQYDIGSVKGGNNLGLSRSYFYVKDYQKAIEYANKGIDILKKRNEPNHLADAYGTKREILEKMGHYKESLMYYKLSNQIKDSILNVKSTSKINRLHTEYIQEKLDREKKLIELAKEEAHKREIQTQRTYIFGGFGSAVVLIVFVFLLWKGYRRKQADNEEISKQKLLVEEKNSEITDSINYAHRIQTAMLPEDGLMQSLFPESFVLLKPKDIVSGDFYWISSIGNKYIFTAADCTGHGVPGGFMSMVGTSLLNVIVNERGITTPSEILSELRHGVKKALKQTGKPGEQKDGMDMALCCYDSKTKKLQYAGANNPLWLITGDKKEITETKGDKRPVGYYMGEGLPFTNHEIQLAEGDCIYIFSDGFPDQFGGPKGKKFKYRPFKTLLLENFTKPMNEQYNLINNTFEEWKGSLEQIDDVCVIGVRV